RNRLVLTEPGRQLAQKTPVAVGGADAQANIILRQLPIPDQFVSLVNDLENGHPALTFRLPEGGAVQPVEAVVEPDKILMRHGRERAAFHDLLQKQSGELELLARLISPAWSPLPGPAVFAARARIVLDEFQRSLGWG